MQLQQIPRTEVFFLIQDEDLAVISNRPFLGDVVRRASFQRVEGFVTRDRATIEKIRELAANTTRLSRSG